MADDPMPREEIIGVVIGAVALFSLISLLPVLIMWHHRRRTAMRAMAETRVLPPVYQVHLQNVLGQPVSVDRWLEEQTVPSNVQQYCQDTCPICLSALSSSPYLACPDPAVLAHGQHNHNPNTATRPDPHNTCGAQHSPPDSEVLVLNRCKHAFHLDCLKSWFEYRRYKCPICQASYSPEEERRG
ncbi:hypothetical protein EN45_049830 [Penicillium chrysogenum]|uniref:RING-type domain-containing protein n=1 Tax=Penicillium chrysogenum TaxID=5076 RepID=A0A167RUF5_PENCH|nr:uncharacterized protein N7525_009718 [Penicillium rubens]KAJ5831465.1 hypothetical protein N7525_009718 [Penicillium rubens]KAJ5855008.1 hypothetical protein N7534_007551 [Penicillium rubens]KZN86458.1 hypothetical protein EN45_049830 [Penicillium chrysogenum]